MTKVKRSLVILKEKFIRFYTYASLKEIGKQRCKDPASIYMQRKWYAVSLNGRRIQDKPINGSILCCWWFSQRNSYTTNKATLYLL